MNTPTTKQLYDLEGHFILSGEELENVLRGSSPKIEHITLRWKFLKKEAVLSDMDHILEFSQVTELSPPKSKSVYKEMRMLLSTLRERKWGKYYSRVVEIMEKYLQGIKKFLSGSEIQEIPFYKKLFEGTMIAIIEEVKTLEGNSSVRVFG